MAGIEGVSAIIAVAELGLSLSKNLIDYVAEVKEASRGIRSLGSEIKTTCERLQDIAGIVKKNRRYHILSHEGSQTAVRASDECESAIHSIRHALRKIDYQDQPDDDGDKDKIDFPLLTRLQWPIVKRKLEAPKAELRRIRADLTLMFTAAMVMLASNQEERATYYRKLPKLEKKQHQREREAKYIKGRNRHRVSQDMTDDSPYNTQRSQSSESETEGVKTDPDFARFKQAQKSEERQKRLREELTKLKAEEEAEEAQAREVRSKIEEEAVEKYKKTLEQQEQAIASRKAFLREELSRQCLPPKQIQSILDNFRFDSNLFDATMGFQAPRVNQLANKGKGAGDAANGGTFFKAPNRRKWPRTFLRYLKGRGQPDPQYTLDEPSCEMMASAGTLNECCFIETWVLDLGTQNWTLYGNRPTKVADNGSKRKSRELWQHYSQIPSLPREALGAFYQWRIKDEPGKWNIYSIDPIKATTRTGIFRRIEEIIGLEVKIARTEVTYEPSQGWSSAKHDVGAPKVGCVGPKIYYPGLESPNLSRKTKEPARDTADVPDLKSAQTDRTSRELNQSYAGAKSTQETKIQKTPADQRLGSFRDPDGPEYGNNIIVGGYPRRYDRQKNDFQGRSSSRRLSQADGYQKSRDYLAGDGENRFTDSSGSDSDDFDKTAPRERARRERLRTNIRRRSSSGTRSPHNSQGSSHGPKIIDGAYSYDDGYRQHQARSPASRSYRTGNEDKTTARALEPPGEPGAARSRRRASSPVRSIIKPTQALRSQKEHTPSFKIDSPSVPQKSEDDIILSILTKYTSFKGNQLPINISQPLALAAPETQQSGAEDDHSKTTAPGTTRELSPPVRIEVDSCSLSRDADRTLRPTVESSHSDDGRDPPDANQKRGGESSVNRHSPPTSISYKKPGSVRFEFDSKYDSLEVETATESDDDNERSDKKAGAGDSDGTGSVVDMMKPEDHGNGEFERGKNGEYETDSDLLRENLAI